MLTVIIPVFNEEKTIGRVLKKVLAQKIVKEIIVIDDGSVDQTREILKKLKHSRIKVFYHKKNSGKGTAIKTGLAKVKTPYVIIQDADLEYNPSGYKKLIPHIAQNQAVYGSRIKGNNKKAYLRTYVGNVLLTQFCNLLFGARLSDSYTCYKLMPTKIAKSLALSSRGFEIEAEITAKLLTRGVKIKEVPISYHPRSYEQGKKIKAKDAFIGALMYLKVRFGS